MTSSEFRLFLDGGMILCALMVVFSILRVRSRGLSAWFLAASFAAMGTVLLGLRDSWSQTAVGICGTAVALCLVGDFLARAAKRQDKP
jgi:TRAP-type C4-dicarboxylate transport system permease small subunit